MNPNQYYLRLTQTVTVDQAHSLVFIPDRTAAECELTRLQHEYGPRLLKSNIRKDRPPKCNPRARTTYTLRYFTREIQTINLF